MLKNLSYVLFIFFVFSFFTNEMIGQNFNLSEVARIPVTPADGGSDIWGYTDENGREYALFGTFLGVRVIDLLDHANPVEVAKVPGNNTIWRDIKTYKHYAYAVMDLSGSGGDGEGLVIMDLSGLPESIEYKVHKDLPFDLELNTCHNAFVEEETGHLYLFGCDELSAGAIIFDLNIDPYNPTVVGTYNGNYVHDGFVRGNLMYTSEVYAGKLSVVDVTNKSMPQRLGSVTTSSNFTHNCWLSDDGNYVFTTDERDNGFIDAYDVSDFTDMKLVDKIQSSPGENVAPHNTFVLNDFLITSYYTDGVTMHDAKFPDHMVQVGAFDTSPNFSGGGFNGCWGVYPYFESGYIIAADIQRGFLVLEPNLQLSSRVLVNVKNTNGQGIFNAKTTLLQNGENIVFEGSTDATDILGIAKMAVLDEGLYDIRVSAANFKDALVKDVELFEGERVVVDVVLNEATQFVANVSVVDEAGNAVSNAIVELNSEVVSFSGLSDEDGNMSADLLDQGSGVFDISVGAWGYINNSVSETLNEEFSDIEIVLTNGYYDDFLVDFGWTEAGNAEAGSWERGVPTPTYFQNVPVSPERDSDTDFGDIAFVTGAGTSTNVSDHDVDDGNTILTSPTFDIGEYENPIIKYEYWFAIAGGTQGIKDDKLIVRLHSGNQTVIVDEVSIENLDLLNIWNEKEIVVAEYMLPSDGMQISFETSDGESWNYVEAAIDKFRIEDSEAPVTFALSGNVVDELGNPISEAVVSLAGSTFESSVKSDVSGNFIVDLSPENYEITIGKWGYQNSVLDPVDLNGDVSGISVVLTKGYEDSFDIDLGWSITMDAEFGNWERGIPTASTFEGETYNPGTGASLSENDFCFTTGMVGNEDANNNDVDNGKTVITSPEFDLTDYENPHINYSRYFSNGGGVTTPDDRLTISLSNGEETVDVEIVSVNTEPLKSWADVNLRVEDYIVPTANMTIAASVADGSFDHIVEAAFDAFSVVDSMSTEEPLDSTDTSIDQITFNIDLMISPNPVSNFMLVEINNYNDVFANQEDLKLNIYDLSGKLIQSLNANSNVTKVNTQELVPGTYIVELANNSGKLVTEKVVKH